MAIKEEIYYNGAPHWGDLILNLILSVFVITLPITIGAIVRALWVRYLITDRRISVTGGWMGRQRTDVVYGEIVNIVSVPRGIGWGDIVVTLKDGSRLELRSLPRFREIYQLIEGKLSFDVRQRMLRSGKAKSA
jgi:hypothetical protein